MKHYIIWGIYGGDSGESLICETVNGGYITSRQQAEIVIQIFKKLINRGEKPMVRNWRIAEIDMAIAPDFAATVNI
jgi:hypothetical protein